MSGALYESIFVVDTSSTGAEILCLIVPAGNCFVVMLRWGSGADISGIFDRLVVKARARDIFADVSFESKKISGLAWTPNMYQGRMEIFGVEGGQFRLDRDRVYGVCSRHLQRIVFRPYFVGK
jgi:hypothetical protein